MQYLLMIAVAERRIATMSESEGAEVMRAYMAYTDAMRKDGVYVGSNRLQGVQTAHTVRIKDGKSEVLNGPYAETREQLGGYYLIDVPDLATAQTWAARCPGARFGAIEVRPIWTM
jgi:hypothetical protein